MAAWHLPFRNKVLLDKAPGCCYHPTGAEVASFSSSSGQTPFTFFLFWNRGYLRKPLAQLEGSRHKLEVCCCSAQKMASRGYAGLQWAGKYLTARMPSKVCSSCSDRSRTVLYASSGRFVTVTLQRTPAQEPQLSLQDDAYNNHYCSRAEMALIFAL